MTFERQSFYPDVLLVIYLMAT